MKRNYQENWRRVVIKIGTNSIMNDFKSVDFRKMDRLAYVCASLIQEGIEVLLVSSGAIGVGAQVLGLDTYPSDIPDQQAVAAVGQVRLMEHYHRFFQYYGQYIAQVLLTKDIFEFENSYRNTVQSLSKLLEKGILPIVNENDVVSDDEMNHVTKFGDNDTLSSLVADMLGADLLILLSDVDALYTGNPKENPQAKKVSQVQEITPDIKAMAQGKGSEFASGGMATKLGAAQRMLDAGKSMVIASGADPDIIFDIMAGQEVGTLFSRRDQR